MNDHPDDRPATDPSAPRVPPVAGGYQPPVGAYEHPAGSTPWATSPGGAASPGSPWPAMPPSSPGAGPAWGVPSSAPGGLGPPPPPGPPYGSPAAGGTPRRQRSKWSILGPLLALLLLAGAVAGGIAVGRNHGTDTTSSVTAVPNTPVTTAVPPLKGDSAEPALAVAKTLGPAVVQIETDSGLGSGFVYDASGLIMTAGHVTDGAKTVTVRLADGTKTDGKVLGQDDSTDVAVVKINPPDKLVVATLATGVPTEVGQTAIAIGSPFGLDQTVTAGIVSAVGRSVQTPGGVIPAVQTDAPINSGNSGGALADRQGRVIGINDSIATGSSAGSGGSGNTGNVGVGFAIPIDIAKGVADKVVGGQSTNAGFLGVEGADATGERSGAAITSVQNGSPADDAGITTDDVVVAVDGRKVSSMVDLAAAVRTHQPGDKVTLTVVRKGNERTVTVTLGTAPKSASSGSGSSGSGSGGGGTSPGPGG